MKANRSGMTTNGCNGEHTGAKGHKSQEIPCISNQARRKTERPDRQTDKGPKEHREIKPSKGRGFIDLWQRWAPVSRYPRVGPTD